MPARQQVPSAGVHRRRARDVGVEGVGRPIDDVGGRAHGRRNRALLAGGARSQDGPDAGPVDTVTERSLAEELVPRPEALAAPQ